MNAGTDKMASSLPDTATCRSLLADGSTVTVTATRRPRGGRAEIKCSAPGAPAIAARMQQVARLARHTEARHDSRDQVVISMDRAPGTHERDWELAVVLADRMARGVVVFSEFGAAPLALGWSEQWQRGRIDGHDARNAHVVAPDALLGGPQHLRHLGALSGQPDAADAVSSARAWFPLHSGGINDSLCWVEVSVYPLDPDVSPDEDAVAAPGLDSAGQLALRQALAGARHFDGETRPRWRTTVRFGQDNLHGNSWELALVLADRLARGREFVPRGRIIASGASTAWHAGQVEGVEGLAPKCALIEREASPGDRVLLPRAWEGGLPPGLRDALRARGASLALVERIGII